MTARDETYAAVRTFDGSAVLTVVDAAGYPVSFRCRPEPAADPAALEVALPSWLTVERGPACLMAHSHDEGMWNLRGILAKGSITVDDDRLLFSPDTFRWLADTGGGTFSVLRRAAGAVLRTRRDAATYLRRTGQQEREVPWQTIVDARRRAKSAGSDR
jgi:hypothetical protein